MRSVPGQTTIAVVGFILILLLSALGCARPDTTELLQSFGPPTVYATVKAPPNPMLLGRRIRSTPSEFKRPDSIEYFLYKDERGYAFHLTWKGKSGLNIDDWMPAEIDGDTIKSGETTIFVEGSYVYHRLQGRDTKHVMARE